MSLQLVVFVVFLCCVVSVFGAPTLTAFPGVIEHTNTPVRVSWVDIQNATLDDIIQMHSPADGPFTNDTLVGLFPVTSLIKGTFEFNLVNIRQTVGFVYVSVANHTNTVVTKSNIVKFTNLAEPTQGHLSLTQNPNEMRVMWVSGSNKYLPMVQYGKTILSLNQTGVSNTYTAEDMCTLPANSTKNGAFRPPGYQHDVLLSNLELNQLYNYRFGNDVEGWSDVFTFVTSPGVGPDKEISFIMFGDLGVNTPFQHPDFWQNFGVEQQIMAPKSLKWIQRYNMENKNKPKLVLDVGDVSYARGYSILWDYFMESIAPVAVNSPWMVAIGNHEYDYHGQEWRPVWSDYGVDSGGECGIPYSYRFHMPGGVNEKLRNLWYSFEMGPVHFTIMSSEHDFLIGSPQWMWIDQDLSQVDRNRTPWVIFMLHRPIYTSSSTTIRDGTTVHLRTDLMPTLLKYHVDLVLTGHVHKYERTCGITSTEFTCGERDEDGIVHIVVGTAGNMFQVPWDDDYGASHKNQPDWSVFRTDEWGISEMTANATTLQFFYYGDQRGEVHDKLVLQKFRK